MINLRKGNTETIYFTGTENTTLTAPFFLFIFTNRTTEDVVKIMATNTSTTARYNKFSTVVNTNFADATEGFWDYEIREKADNTDMTIAGTVVETGFMYLRPATDFTPVEYAGTDNDFKTYNG